MAAFCRLYEMLLVAVRIIHFTPVPNPHHAVARRMSEIFNAPIRADDGVVAPRIRRVMALLIRCESAVVQLHLHHAEVFDIDVRMHAFL